ncbi:MAG: hypothetical protein M1814_003768 [Vezdaea aestivalis]|nr:MAG: hypothetical protein M1814_003768 [Vezdaea aestivalis]
MGAIAIWCMHYIGNRAIILGNGAADIQIAYNSGFTAGSFFIPIVVLLAAFLAIGSNEKVRQIRVILGGTLAGAAICGMHYLGQAGIANYDCLYNFQNVVGAAIIAIVASVIALWVFFVLRAGWTNSWWKRALCALLLAAAVSGMHWLASTGTEYRFKSVKATTDAQMSLNDTVIAVIVLAVSCCTLLLGLAFIAQRKRLQSADRAQQVVLACATFDSQGRLLVTSEGLLPSQKITNSYIERSFDDIFSVSHPVFLWIFRTTRNWRGIADLIPGMRSHLQTTTNLNSSRTAIHSHVLDHTNEDQGPEEYSVMFRELFCVAACELADQINEPLENVGVLYDEIMSTGVTHKTMKKSDSFFNETDLESNKPTPFVFGRGQVLFVVRRCNKTEAARLQASGFRFAGTQNIVDILARRMQVHKSDLARHIDSMQQYSRGDHILNPGVHLACFAIRASVRGGFDVLVRKDAKNQLPTMQLPIGNLEPWHREFLDEMTGWTVSATLKHLNSKTKFLSAAEQLFVAQLFDTIVALAEEIADPFFHDAQLVTKPIFAPCRGFGDYPQPGKSALLAFRIIVPIHSQTPNPRLVYSPLFFFRTQQYIYRNMPDHDVFARRIHREFAPILGPPRQTHSRNRDVISPTPSSPLSPPPPSIYAPPTLHKDKRPGMPTHKSWFGLSSDGGSMRREKVGGAPSIKSDSASEKGLVERNPFGGIMVSQEVSVDVREMAKTEGGLEMKALGTVGSAATEVEDSPGFVDMLFTETVEGR